MRRGPAIPYQQRMERTATVIVDSHTHILPAEFRTERERILRLDATFRELFADARSRIATAEDLIEEMDGAHVDVSVAVGYGWTDAGVARESNDYLLDSARSFPGRIVPFCSVNPLWGTDAVEEVVRCVEAGARGVGELHPDTQGTVSADLATLAPALDAARELGVPVLFHASEPVGHAYPGKGTVTPDLLEALVRAYPRNDFIFAHFGGGLPFYSLMPEVRRAMSRVHFDSAAFPYLYRPEAFSVAAAACGAERVLFASDYPLVGQSRALREARSAGLSPDSERLVMGGNAARLFGLDGPASS